MHRIRGVIIGAVYSGRKEVIGFTFSFIKVIYIVNEKVIYYPCDEMGVITISSDLKGNFNLPDRQLDIFIECYEVYVPNQR